MTSGKIFYVCLKTGNDETGSGSKEAPFLTIVKAIEVHAEAEVFVRKESTEAFEAASGNSLKKAKKELEGKIKKAKKALEREGAEAEKEAQRLKRLEEAMKVVIIADKSLPEAKRIKLRDAIKERNVRIKVFGWVHNIRVQGKSLMFILLRDGTGYIQCVLNDKLCETYDALTLTRESTVCVYGTIKEVPAGKSAPNGHELIADYWEVVHKAPGGLEAFETQFNEDANPDILLRNRHLVLREDKPSKILKLRSFIVQCFRQHLFTEGYNEVTPPCLVQTQCEGGATLFHLNYYGQDAYLTQSSQLYLETAIPSLGDVFCIQESFRAERSHTPRHLSEFTHLEAECPFITFDDLLARLEHMICDVIDRVLSSPYAEMLKDVNPNFKAPARPFMRMTYIDAIKWLNDNKILKEDDDGKPVGPFEFGDDIPQKPEKIMVKHFGVPIFLCEFPVEIKSFYMARCKHDERVTESVDVLMPGVGEIVGGSMRIWDMDQLMEGYKREGIDPSPYYWFTDQRKYGSCPHGGYGLGLERFLAWILGVDNVREVCLFPRFHPRCQP